MGKDVSGRDGAVGPDKLLASALMPVPGEQQCGFEHLDGALEQFSCLLCSRHDIGRQREPIKSTESSRGVVRQEYIHGSRSQEAFGFRWFRFLQVSPEVFAFRPPSPVNTVCAPEAPHADTLALNYSSSGHVAHPLR